MFSPVKKKQKRLKFLEFNSIKNIISPDMIRQKTRDIVIQANIALNSIPNNKPRIALIQAPTGSGKTHSIVDELKYRDIDRKVAIAIPTRANVFNLSELTDSLAVDFGTHVGGEDGEDKSVTDIGTIYTYGKLFEIIKHDPMLNEYSELILDEADMITFGQEIRYIPYLVWLLKARPDLKIILLSATLDVQGFQELFKVDKKCIFTLEQGRPRPIKSLYISHNEAVAENIIAPYKASKYLMTTHKLIGEQMSGNNPMLPGEAMIVFLPTINGVNRLTEELKLKYSNNIEVRALHSRVSRNELEKAILNPIDIHKVGIIVATDIIGRGINFGEELRINRVIHSGLVNQRTYNPIIQRDILKVAPASQNEVIQAMGRGGRHINDTRPVFGFSLQPYTTLRATLSTMFNKHDPTLMILSSIVVYNKIKEKGRCVPTTLIDYISSVGLDKKKVTQTLDRLKAINAITSDNKITKLGLYLASCNIDLDYALLLYYSSEEEYLTNCRVLSLIIRSYNLVDYENQQLYNSFLDRAFRQKGIKSDFEVYKYLLDVITSKAEAEKYGINYNIFEECIRTAKNLAKLQYQNEQVREPMIINNLLQFKRIKKSPYGTVYEYIHLASNTTVNIHSSSIIYHLQPPYFAFAFNISMIGDNYVASDIMPVTMEQLQKSNDPMIVKEVGDMQKFNPDNLSGEYEKRLVYKGYYSDTQLAKELVKFKGGQEAIKPLVKYAQSKAPQYLLNQARRISLANPDYKHKDIIYYAYYDYATQHEVKSYKELSKASIDLTKYQYDFKLLPPESIVIDNTKYPINYIENYRVIEIDQAKLAEVSTEYDSYHINISKHAKPNYINIKTAKKTIVKTQADKEQKKALKTLESIDLGPINMLEIVPVLPEAVEYFAGHKIYPHFDLAYNNHVVIKWTKKKVNSHNLLNKINHSIQIQQKTKTALELLSSDYCENKLFELLKICHNDENDKSYIEKKVLLQAIRGNQNSAKLATQVDNWLRDIEQECKYVLRGIKGIEIVKAAIKEFNKKYSKAYKDQEVKLMLDEVTIAKATPTFNFEKNKYQLVVEEYPTKVINDYIPFKFAEIKEI
jgi:HrpA-like RNA helicase